MNLDPAWMINHTCRNIILCKEGNTLKHSLHIWCTTGLSIQIAGGGQTGDTVYCMLYDERRMMCVCVCVRACVGVYTLRYHR